MLQTLTSSDPDVTAIASEAKKKGRKEQLTKAQKRRLISKTGTQVRISNIFRSLRETSSTVGDQWAACLALDLFSVFIVCFWKMRFLSVLFLFSFFFLNPSHITVAWRSVHPILGNAMSQTP